MSGTAWIFFPAECLGKESGHMESAAFGGGGRPLPSTVGNAECSRKCNQFKFD